MRAYHAAIAAAAVFTLSGCGNMASNRSLESVHQPVVSRSNYTLDLNAQGGSLRPVPETCVPVPASACAAGDDIPDFHEGSHP